jgi:hypothetical protein
VLRVHCQEKITNRKCEHRRSDFLRTFLLSLSSEGPIAETSLIEEGYLDEEGYLE